MELVKPKRLQKGDTIRIVSPANSMRKLSDGLIAEGVRTLEKLGLNVQICDHAKDSYGHTAGTAKQRADALMSAFEDDKVNAIMTTFGGFNSNDIIEYLDYRTIRNNPKVFIGFSDITVLNTVLYKKAGLVNFHGPAFVTMGHPVKLAYEMEMFRDILFNGKKYECRASPVILDDPEWYKKEGLPKTEPNPGWEVIQRGKARGRLIGGNIGTLLALSGTKYWPDLEGALLFVEDDEDENPASIARFFRQLRHIGAYDSISGLLIGRFSKQVGFNADDSIRMIVNEVCEGYDFPIVSELDFGHTRPLMTIPVGIDAKLDTDKRTLIYLEAAVRW